MAAACSTSQFCRNHEGEEVEEGERGGGGEREKCCTTLNVE